MNTTILTSAWDAIILNFSPVFTQPTAQIFINLVTGWVLCTCRRTITGILPFAEPKGKRPHDAYHRMFPKSRRLSFHLWKVLAQLLIGTFYPSRRREYQIVAGQRGAADMEGARAGACCGSCVHGKNGYFCGSYVEGDYGFHFACLVQVRLFRHAIRHGQGHFCMSSAKMRRFSVWIRRRFQFLLLRFYCYKSSLQELFFL